MLHHLNVSIPFKNHWGKKKSLAEAQDGGEEPDWLEPGCVQSRALVDKLTLSRHGPVAVKVRLTFSFTVDRWCAPWKGTGPLFSAQLPPGSDP